MRSEFALTHGRLLIDRGRLAMLTARAATKILLAVSEPSGRSDAIDFVHAEQCYVVMTNVAFATAALLPGSQQPLHVRNLGAVNATVCSDTCRKAKNVVWPAGGRNVTVNCTLWRYCMDPNGCPSSSPQYTSLDHRTCQLQSYYSLDLGFAQGPYQALGNMAVPVPNSLYGAPITGHCRKGPGLCLHTMSL